uniref:Cysteine-rich receptor-like protein kinase 35 n=1 Tax=Brassica oleracea var. oleracea TaxID=109376 RepID=A0A0D3E9A2_BRAOL
MKLKTSCLLIFCSFLTSLDAVSAQICLNGYFRPNSAYHSNRRQILSSIASNVTSHNGFFNSSIGHIPNRIFITGMCIPETKPESCSDCIKGASGRLLERCPNQTEAYSWPDLCMVRYSNVSFTGSLVMEPSHVICDPGDINVDFTVFDRVYEELMVRTTAAASNRSSSFEQKYYAAEAASLKNFETMYTMMQCAPDVSSRDCKFCLNKSVAEYKSSCRGKQGGWVSRPSCYFRWEMYSFSEAFDTITLPPPPPHPSPPSLTPPASDGATTTGKDGKTSLTGTIVAVVVPTIVIFLAVLIIRFTVCRRKKSEPGDDITRTSSLQFCFKTIETATDKFSDSNLIGQGGFGEVYRGRLPSGTEVAVKRLSKSSGQGAQEFKNEAVLVTKLQHKNLVGVLGFCLEGEEKILVYEFVPNKSLDYFLFDPEKQGKLDWTRRYSIIQGTARGLLYLHHDSSLTIIHRDLKASNILLDAHMNPKIADFGMARIFGVDQSQANTKRIVGTYGYMSPEYARCGHFSMKSDVYSFGVMILEIISGKRNSSFYHIDDSAGNLVTHVWRLWRNGSQLELVDPTLEENYESDDVIRCIHIALLCVQENPVDRPMLPAIILMLTRSKTTLPVPRAPGFCFSSMSGFASQSTSRSIPGSINDVTFTKLDPR